MWKYCTAVIQKHAHRKPVTNIVKLSCSHDLKFTSLCLWTQWCSSLATEPSVFSFYLKVFTDRLLSCKASEWWHTVPYKVMKKQQLGQMGNHTDVFPHIYIVIGIPKIIGSRPSDHYFRSVCLFVCLCRVFLSRLWSDFDQTRTYVICLGLVVSPRI